MASSERTQEERIRFLNSFYSPNNFRSYFFKCKDPKNQNRATILGTMVVKMGVWQPVTQKQFKK